MSARDINYRRLFRDLAILVAIIVSGAALSAMVMQVTVAKVFIVVVATVAAIVLAPRHWLRFAAFILFMAAWFGVAVIGSDYGRHALYDTPLPRSGEEYLLLTALSVIFAAAWLSWWLWSRRIRDASVDT